jgi:MerR family redox-sensitive transcriptional activator SoxR
MAANPAPLPELLTIGQLATRGGIAASALRFYEEQGLLIGSRTERGQRRYQRDALRRVAFIKAAQEVGLSLDDIKRALDVLPTDSNATEADWQALADKWRPMLDERIRLLEHLRRDRGECIGCGCLTLSDCTRQNPNDVAYAIGHSAQYLLGRTLDDALAADAKARSKRSR